jgi:hypothetical protein
MKFEFIKKHFLIILLALAISCLTALPQLLASRALGDKFQGIYKVINSDDLYYMARAKDIIDGHSYLTNPYLYEHKEGFAMQFWLPDYILAKPLAIFNINLYHGYIFYDFLLPFILVILTYTIIFLLTGSRVISFLGSSFLHVGLFLWEFGRSPSPQLIFIFWLLLLLFWLRFLEKPNLFNTLALGLTFGLLFHLYPYYWTFYLLVFGFFILFNFLLKKPIEYKKYFLALFIALVISIPYFLSLIKSMELPYYSESVARVGMIDSHFPRGKRIMMWCVFALLFFYFLNRKKVVSLNTKSILLLSGILSAIVATNQNVITGKHLQFSNHYWQLSAFWSTFTSLYLMAIWINTKDLKIKKLLIILGGIFVFIISLNPVVKACQITYTEHEISQQNYFPMFKWINENILPEEVIFANSELSDLIPIYTANNVFYAGMAGLHFMPNKEFQERYILNNYWSDFNKPYVMDNYYAIAGAYYTSRYGHDLTKNELRKILFMEPKKYEFIPEEVIDKFIKFAQEIKTKDFLSQLKKYKVDYFVWDKKKDLNWPVDKLNFLEPVHEVNNLVIYKVK